MFYLSKIFFLFFILICSDLLGISKNIRYSANVLQRIIRYVPEFKKKVPVIILRGKAKVFSKRMQLKADTIEILNQEAPLIRTKGKFIFNDKSRNIIFTGNFLEYNRARSILLASGNTKARWTKIKKNNQKGISKKNIKQVLRFSAKKIYYNLNTNVVEANERVLIFSENIESSSGKAVINLKTQISTLSQNPTLTYFQDYGKAETIILDHRKNQIKLNNSVNLLIQSKNAKNKIYGNQAVLTQTEGSVFGNASLSRDELELKAPEIRFYQKSNLITCNQGATGILLKSNLHFQTDLLSFHQSQSLVRFKTHLSQPALIATSRNRKIIALLMANFIDINLNYTESKVRELVSMYFFSGNQELPLIWSRSQIKSLPKESVLIGSWGRINSEVAFIEGNPIMKQGRNKFSTSKIRIGLQNKEVQFLGNIKFNSK